MTFLGRPNILVGKMEHYIRWSSLVGKQKHNVQKPIFCLVFLVMSVYSTSQLSLPQFRRKLNLGTWMGFINMLSFVSWTHFLMNGPLHTWLRHTSKFYHHASSERRTSSRLHLSCLVILFNSTALGIYLCKTSQLDNLKTRLGEICSSDVNMHKGRWLSMAKRVGNKQLVFRTQRGLSWCCSLAFVRGKTTMTTQNNTSKNNN